MMEPEVDRSLKIGRMLQSIHPIIDWFVNHAMMGQYNTGATCIQVKFFFNQFNFQDLILKLNSILM